MNNSQRDFLDIFQKINFTEIKKHPNILIAARFWDEERYQAACMCYRFMRTIDDMIDDHKSVYQRIDRATRNKFLKEIYNKLRSLKYATEDDHGYGEILSIFKKFKMPLWPFELFASSMIYDLDHDGFETIESFLDYSQGASVAPASIFVHLCCLNQKKGKYYKPAWNIREVATPCAMFSYLVHIIRDFQQDQKENLNYFAEDVIHKYGLTAQDLRTMAMEENYTGAFRNMINEYYQLAGFYKNKTYAMIRLICPYLEPNYQLSLLIIFNLYLMVYENIDVANGKFSGNALVPSMDEIKCRVLKVIMEYSENQYTISERNLLSIS